MEFGNDLIGALRDRLGRNAEDGLALHPDWLGLRGSQAAAYAARRELLRDMAARPASAASFARSAAAQLLAGYDASQLVNRTALGDGKCRPGIDGFVAGTSMTGDQGQ